MSTTHKTGQEQKPTHAHPTKRTTSTPRQPTYHDAPIYTSRVDGKVFFESTMRVLTTMLTYVTAAMAEYAPASPRRRQLQTKRDEIAVLRAACVRHLEDASRTLDLLCGRSNAKAAATKKPTRKAVQP